MLGKMVETSISSFVDSISIYRSRVFKTWVLKSKTESLRLDFVLGDLKKNRGKMIWRGMIWRGSMIWSEERRDDLKRHNLVFRFAVEERRRRTKNARKKKWNSSLKNSISTNRDLKTQFLSGNSSFRHSRC